MSFQLSFDRLLKYDAGQPGITIDVLLKLTRDEVPCTTKLDTGSTFASLPVKLVSNLAW